MDSLIRLQRFAGNYRTASWHRGKGHGRTHGPPLAFQSVPADGKSARAMQLRRRADAMRRHPTKAEWRAWKSLKALCLPFRQQVPVGPYILDFLLTTRLTVLEIDGEEHKRSTRYDAARDRYFRAHGFHVVRVPNEQATLAGLRAVLEGIDPCHERITSAAVKQTNAAYYKQVVIEAQDKQRRAALSRIAAFQQRNPTADHRLSQPADVHGRVNVEPTPAAISREIETAQ